MTTSAVLLDANVLYPAPLRDLLLQLAVAGLFRAKWTARIHEEWIESLLRNEPHRNREVLNRTRDLMNSAIRDCLVSGYEARIPELSLPDNNDNHVLAAAITVSCDILVTYTLRDFPESTLAKYGIDVLHPDQFLQFQLNRAPDIFCNAVQRVRARLQNPPFNVEQYLATLRQQGLTATTESLVPLSAIL